MNATDLRGILRYVPSFRDRLFVFAFDGATLRHENFPNLLQDLAVLRSLNIRVAIAHGISSLLAERATERGVDLSDRDGSGVTDPTTFRMALECAYELSHRVLAGLGGHDLRACLANGIITHPAGILAGVDQQWTGRVERVDASFIQSLVDSEVIPVFPPIGFDGEGGAYRVNSDRLAVCLAQAMEATKIVFVIDGPGIMRKGRLVRQIEPSDLENALRRGEIDPQSVSKAQSAVQACHLGIPRVHIVNGGLDECLLDELFSNEGVGTLVYDNQYQSVRPAEDSDVPGIMSLTRRAMETEELAVRDESMIAEQAKDYFLFEVDDNLIGCVALHTDGDVGEIASLCVSPGHTNRGIGRKLLEYAEATARARGLRRLFALSTQAFTFFETKAAFRRGEEEDLPPARRLRYQQSPRRSRILVKDLHEDAKGFAP